MNLIYQYFIPYQGLDAKHNKGIIGLPDWAKIGMYSAQRYAKHIGAEYMFTDQIHLNASLNVFESFRIFILFFAFSLKLDLNIRMQVDCLSPLPTLPLS